MTARTFKQDPGNRAISAPLRGMASRFCAARVMAAAMLAVGVLSASPGWSQAVCLPAPRLLTTMPMGGQAGTQVEVTITGQSIEAATDLLFSHPGITAVAKLNEQGETQPNQYVVTITDDCPAGVYDARVLTPAGLSSSRVFSVGTLTEIVQSAPSADLASALPLELNMLCNAVMSARAINHYRFHATQGQRLIVDCAASGIDSKLSAVLIVADAEGRDLMVERLGDLIDFTVPADGDYVVKVHDMTFKGGAEYFYRLALRVAEPTERPQRMASTHSVQSFSWPPMGLPAEAPIVEHDAQQDASQSQLITVPTDIAGSFFPAADVDTYEFTAKQGEVWWVEVASARLGFPTDPAVLVQQIVGEGDATTFVDVAELNDIASPVKVSSNGYAYDGPPYNAGSADVLGRVEIKTDGRYRLQISDLFGGTRNDPRNAYRLIIRKAEPDFAVVAWALHMELRNGDRNALSKPMALRPGATMALEVVVVRRDGFEGAIELVMEDLPPGVSACGLKIPAGQSRGIMLVTADEAAPHGYANAKFYGRAEIHGAVVTHPCRLASMAWPLTDAWSEIPSPRLLADVPVSVSATEVAPISIASLEQRVWEATEGQPVTIPLVQHRRSEFSGASIALKTFGAGFETNPQFEVPLDADHTEIVLDLAQLKTPPGEYKIAFYGSAVAKYAAPSEAEEDAAKPVATKDIVDIVVSEPIMIRVNPAEVK